MAVVQVNTPGIATTDEGYISSITLYTGGSATVLTRNSTTGQVTMSALAATKLVQGHSAFKLITG